MQYLNNGSRFVHVLLLRTDMQHRKATNLPPSSLYYNPSSTTTKFYGIFLDMH